MGCDINKPENKEGSTALIIAAKRNMKSVVNYLLENSADAKLGNNLSLNALDYAVIHGNYEIAYNIISKHSEIKLQSLDSYIESNTKMKVPSFNIPLFYQNLNDNVEPAKTPSFALSNDERNKLEGKLPDPNETWGDFFRRVLKFELYRPPLVEKKSIPLDKRNSLFVRMQTKLLEIEYNKESKNWDFILFIFILNFFS